MATDFNLRREKTAKPVLGSDDLLLLLTHLWARDVSVFPTEDQHFALATIMLLLMYTGCRPAEMVDAWEEETQGKAKREATGCIQDDNGDNWGSGYESMDESRGGDPVYGNPEPWINQKDGDYDDITKGGTNTLKWECESRCYEDICLWIVQNPTPGWRDLLAVEP